MAKGIKDIKLTTYEYAIKVTGWKGACPYCKHEFKVEEDTFGNTVAEEYCECFQGFDPDTCEATFMRMKK